MKLTMGNGVDILFVSYNRPEYTRQSLEKLLGTCESDSRVWIWHNGNHEETLEAVRAFLDHPRVFRFHHSPLNEKLRTPTNWMWSEATGEFLSKVDDDCIVADDWLVQLREAHNENPRFGIIGCWRFHDDDFIPTLARKKIETFEGGHQLLRNLWIEGTGYLMKRECQQALGLLGQAQSFQDYCLRVAKLDWINGWYYPFIPQEHMDDPRSPKTLLKTDDDLANFRPLSAQRTGVRTLAEWQAQLQQSARILQGASLEIKRYEGWRKMLSRIRGRWLRMLGRRGWVDPSRPFSPSLFRWKR